MVVGTRIQAEFRQESVAIALDGARLAVSEYIQAIADRVFSPSQQFVANGFVFGVGQHSVHRQPFDVIRGFIVQVEVHPQRVVVGEQA